MLQHLKLTLKIDNEIDNDNWRTTSQTLYQRLITWDIYYHHQVIRWSSSQAGQSNPWKSIQKMLKSTNNAPKCARHCQNWPNHEKLSTWKQFYVHTTFVPKAQMPTSLEAYLWRSSQYNWVQITSFRSPRPLCSNHSTWPFVAIYVPDVHGDIPPSLMVL